MSLPSISPELLRAGDNRFLSRFIPMLGISLSEMDYLRGWRDDFFGDVIADQYSTAVYGGGAAAALVNNAHGGVVVLASAAAVSGSQLYLGGGYNTLDADEGWVCLARASITQTTNIGMFIGALNGNNYIQAAADTAIGGNWYIRNDNNSGAVASVDTGVAIDNTQAHWFVLEVSSGLIKLYIDGAHLATQTVKVPTAVIQPFFGVHAYAAAVRSLYVDFVAWIPRNLA